MTEGNKILQYIREDDMNTIQIQDVILHKNKYYTQVFIVINRSPIFKYERKENWLIAEDSGFFSFYQYIPPSKGFYAFAGREFTIPMVDGTFEKAYGQWWDGVPSEYLDLLVSTGCSTLVELDRCYVFYGGRYFYKSLVAEWLLNNEPSNNYNKYCKSSPYFGKHTIDSRW